MTSPVTIDKNLLFIDLKFHAAVSQTRLMRWFPAWLAVEYTRLMMAAISLGPWPTSIGLIGLGGGAQAHFCYRYFPQAIIRVVENHPDVVRLRHVFQLPADSQRFVIDLADGGRWIKAHTQAFDLLLVDAYTAEGLADQVANWSFYRACKAALKPQGRVSFNLFGCPLADQLALIRREFSDQVIVMPATVDGNTVAIATNQRLSQTLYHHRQLALTARWQLRHAMRQLQNVLALKAAGQPGH